MAPGRGALPPGCDRARARSARRRGSCRSTPARTGSAPPPPRAASSPCTPRGSSFAAQPRSRALAGPRPGSRACDCGGSARRSGSAGSAAATGRGPGRRSARSPPPGTASPTSRSRAKTLTSPVPDQSISAGSGGAPRSPPTAAPGYPYGEIASESSVSAISRTTSGRAIAEPPPSIRSVWVTPSAS